MYSVVHPISLKEWRGGGGGLQMTILIDRLVRVGEVAGVEEEGKVFHRSNHMYELKHFGMVWQRHIREKCCGAQRKPYF